MVLADKLWHKYPILTETSQELEASEIKSEVGMEDKQKLEERRRRYRKNLKQFTDTFDNFLESYENILGIHL